jgi:catechol 2,3-dioxygenase-like lactoylglutathione lyase family enzyme
MPEPLIRKVDCVSFPVPNLDEALGFYRDMLGHELIWRTSTVFGLRLPESETELVFHTEGHAPAAELLVEAVPEAVARFREAGGSVISEPFEIPIGRCAVVSDP